jgi:hypothetical protein
MRGRGRTNGHAPARRGRRQAQLPARLTSSRQVRPQVRGAALRTDRGMPMLRWCTGPPAIPATAGGCGEAAASRAGRGGGGGGGAGGRACQPRSGSGCELFLRKSSISFTHRSTSTGSVILLLWSKRFRVSTYSGRNRSLRRRAANQRSAAPWHCHAIARTRRRRARPAQQRARGSFHLQGDGAVAMQPQHLQVAVQHPSAMRRLKRHGHWGVSALQRPQ